MDALVGAGDEGRSGSSKCWWGTYFTERRRMVRGYKAFNADMTCRGFQYEVGKTYEMDSCKLCDHGFHFCKNIADCFTYYFSDGDRFAEVEAYGDVEESESDSKCVTNKIRIVKEIPYYEAILMSTGGQTIFLFGKPSNLTLADWYTSRAATLLRMAGENVNDRQKWWDELSDDDKETIKAIPNFDADKFYECAGVRV